MSIPLIINGVTFNYPQQFDLNWGPTLTNWSSAVTNALQITSNNFTLLTNHSIIFKDSEGTPKSLTLGIPSPLTASWALTLPVNAGTVGQVLSTNGAGVTSWINAAGGGTINSGTTGQLAYYPGNGTTLSGETMSGDATIAAGGALTIANSAITDVKVAAAAAIAVTKLAALTASRVVATDGSGFLSASGVTSTTLAFLDATSSIQTQLNTLTSNQANYLLLSGGTMSGAINMGSNKITSLTQGASTGEAISFPVNTAQISANAITQIQNSTSASATFSGVTVTTVTITTTGNPVLLMGSLYVTTAGGNGGNAFTVNGSITRGGVAVAAGGSQGIQFNTSINISATEHNLSLLGVDNPAAGTYTYTLAYNGSGSPVYTTHDYSLVAIEIKK